LGSVIAGAHLFTVAQIFNLLYRRFVIGRTLLACGRLKTCDTAQRGEAATNMILPRMNTDERKPVVIRVNPCPSVVKKIFAGCEEFERY
jgi:hypothetical protein